MSCSASPRSTAPRDRRTLPAPHPHDTSQVLVAVEKGHPGVMRALIMAGADVDKAKTDTGATPCCIAAGNGHVEVLRALVEAGADEAVPFAVQTVSLRSASGFSLGKPRTMVADGGCVFVGCVKVSWRPPCSPSLIPGPDPASHW